MDCLDFGTPKVTTMNVRVNLLAIFVLSICSTCAHAQFDTVINLPENPDSPNPSGFSGNSIGNNSGISSDTQLNVSDGGSIMFFFEAGAEDVPSTNVEVNISGGTVGIGFDANSGSTINISGGTVGDIDANSGSTVNISGGVVDRFFDAESGSTVNISGGTVGRNFNAFDGSTVNISGGAVGAFFDAFSGSTVNISGGEVGPGFDAESGSTVNISGGTVGFDFDANSGSTVNISGGTVGFSFAANSGSTVNISGGTFGVDFEAESGSTVNIFATDFFLNDTSIDTLTVGETIAIFDRGEDVVLSGVFADGTLFDFDLIPNLSLFYSLDFFDPSSTLTITRVAAIPEPGCGLTLATMSLVLLVRRRRRALRYHQS